MRLLILGGTRFLGRHLAAQALARGDRVTLLHRGRSGSALFPQAEHRLADRDGDLAALAGTGTWDACIDTCGYVPRQVRSVARVLAGRVGQYQFVSSVSVYDGFDRTRTDESAPRAVLADPATEQVTGDTYGALKAACEDEALRGFGARARIVRPGLIVGPFDPSGRFTWWVARLRRAAHDSAAREVVAPGDPAAAVQVIDARDLAAWQLALADRAPAGEVFNATGPAEPTALGTLLDTARATLAPEAAFTWLDDDFLLREGVAPWTGLPLWLPAADAGLHRVDSARARAAGLMLRPLAETVADTAAWVATAPVSGLVEGVGLSPAREQALLAAWHARSR